MCLLLSFPSLFRCPTGHAGHGFQRSLSVAYVDISISCHFDSAFGKGYNYLSLYLYNYTHEHAIIRRPPPMRAFVGLYACLRMCIIHCVFTNVHCIYIQYFHRQHDRLYMCIMYRSILTRVHGLGLYRKPQQF